MRGLLLSVFAFILLTGCAATQSKTVRDNTFYSLSSPTLKVKVDNEFQYLGEEKSDKLTDKSNNFRTHKYIFVNSDKSSEINKAIKVQFSILNNGYWNSDAYHGFKNLIKKDTVKINGKFYQRGIYLANLGNGKFYTEKGFIPPSKLLVFSLVRLTDASNRIKMYISYIENFNKFKDLTYEKSSLKYTRDSWLNYDGYDENQNSALRNFIVRAMESIDIENMSEADKSVFEHQGKSNTSDKSKLIELKSLLDKGIITQQEFDEKKKKYLKSY